MAARTIILAVDHSDASHSALDWTLDNFYRSDDVLYLVHCFKPLQPAVGKSQIGL
jgi:nucleotide-binding universal stress UspA family protein